jgi:hypothetical protein
MTKKLKQGQKYPKGFTQTQILLKLCEKDRTPTSEILDFLKEQFYIREQKNIREHHLKILEKQKLIRRESAGRGHPDYWSVIPDFRVLKELVDMLNHDPDSQHKFMLSQYYRGLIPEMVEEFKALMPSYIDEHIFHSFSTQYEEKMPIYAEKDDPLFYSMWLCRRSPLAEGESLKHALTTFKIDFTEEDENCLAESLKHNWLTLKYIMLCISITDEERERMILQIWFAVNDSRLSPSAARKDGWLTALDSVGHLISKKAEYVAAYDSFYDAVRSEPSINWTEFFCQLDHFNSAYRFLM